MSEETKMSDQVIDVEAKADDDTDEEAPSTEVATLEEVVEALPEAPITPELSELTRMAQIAATFANAKLVPSALYGSPEDVLLIMFTARSLGIDYATGFRELYVIDGKVSMSTKQKLALVRKSKLAEIWPDEGNDELSATWYARRHDQPNVLYKSTFTLEDARRVEAKVDGRWTTLDQKPTYRQFPKRMLSWRSLGYLLDDTCPEVATGIYSPDELGAATNADGDVIDIKEIEPVVQSDANRQRTERAQTKQELAPENERVELKARVTALPDEIRLKAHAGDQSLEARWEGAGFPSCMEMPAGSLRKAKAMVRGFESKAKTVEAAESPSTDPGDAGASATPETQEAANEGPIVEDSSDADEATPGGYPADETEQRRMIASELSDTLEGVDAGVRAAAVDFAKKLHHARLDKGLEQRSEDTEGLHIDSRRMLAVAYLVAEWPETGVPGLDEDWVQEESADG